MTRKVLIVDDDPTCNEFLAYILEDEGYVVRSAKSAEEAFAEARAFDPDVLVADWWLKDGMDGAEVASELRKRYSELQVIFTTGSPAEQLTLRLGDMPAVRILEKPIDVDALIRELRKDSFAHCVGA